MSERIIDIEDEDEAYSELTRRLLDMIRSPHSMTAMRAASSKSAVERVLLEGLKHPVAAVRQACVVNPKATRNVIVAGLQDSDSEVVIAALKDELVTEQDMMQVVEHSSDLGVLATIASKSKDAKVLQEVCEKTPLLGSYNVNMNLLLNDQTPSTALDRMLYNKSFVSSSTAEMIIFHRNFKLLNVLKAIKSKMFIGPIAEHLHTKLHQIRESMRFKE